MKGLGQGKRILEMPFGDLEAILKSQSASRKSVQA